MPFEFHVLIRIHPKSNRLKSPQGNERQPEFGGQSRHICLDVFDGSYDPLLDLSRRSMANEPFEVPPNALSGLCHYAIRQGWEV